MTLKRYQPARRRKRPSKKNRPLKVAVAFGVVGVAVGLAYLSLHGEVLMGLLDGSVDLPDHRFRGPAPVAAAPHAVKAPVAAARPTATPMATPKAAARLATVHVAPSVEAVPPTPAAPSVAPMHSALPVQPSAFPEGRKKPSHEPLMAGATVLKPSGVASFQPAKPALKPSAQPLHVAQVATPTPAKPSPAAVAVKPTPKPAVKAAVAPSARPVAIAAKPVSAPRAVAAAAGRGGSLYFDKNSSYLSAAEKDRLASLVDALARKGGTIHVAGYADAAGDVSYSRWIAGRRANRVAELIRARAAGKVTVVVDDVDVVKGTDDAKNRRVELQIK